MVPERLLLGGAAAVVVVSAIAAVAVPGALSPDDPGQVRPAALRVAELNIAPGAASGETATLSIETRLDHRGGPAENVTLLLRAVGLESGLVETTREVDVEPIQGDREVAVTENLTVPREGGYRIEAVTYVDGERRASGSRTVRGVGGLAPEYARTSVQFHRFQRTGQPSIEYSIAGVQDDRATLRIRTYLTNTGSESPGGLRLSLTARQADSGIVADETEVTVGEIAPGRTATPEAELLVPDGYNYYLDAVLWKDGVIVGSARSVANLDPQETISANVTTRDVGLDVSDFERDGGGAPERERPAATESAGQPGFTAPLAVAVLLGAVVLVRRWSA
ncbi:MAG TPA: PGF-CTERM sorting domain-containing protein [Halobacteriales archaeon]|nr:PGF-CTERM sorting domain-containing protein [Halobacteriales archaeon]